MYKQHYFNILYISETIIQQNKNNDKTTFAYDNLINELNYLPDNCKKTSYFKEQINKDLRIALSKPATLTSLKSDNIHDALIMYCIDEDLDTIIKNCNKELYFFNLNRIIKNCNNELYN